MKTSHIVGISAGAVVGSLVLGGGAFAAGVNLGARDDIRQMVSERVDQRYGDHDAAERREHGGAPDSRRGEKHERGRDMRDHGRGDSMPHGDRPGRFVPGDQAPDSPPETPDPTAGDVLPPLA